MPRRNSLISRLRHGRAWDEWDEQGGEEPEAPPPVAETVNERSRRRRLAVTLTFAVLFVAGAAFSASAGDQVRLALENSAVGAATSTDATTTDPAPASTDPAPVTDPSTDGSSADTSSSAPAESTGDTGGSALAPSGSATPPAAVPPAAAPPAAVAPVSAPAASVAAKSVVQQAATRSGSVSRASTSRRPARSPQRKYMRTVRSQSRQHHFPVKAHRGPAPELEGAASAVVYLNRALPDPTPPALRLTPRFARHLQSVARANNVSWPLLLGVLRSEGHSGSAPANVAGLRALASQLSHLGVRSASPWASMFSLSSNAAFADRAVALSHYYRAVGLPALVNGLLAEKTRLGEKVLNDPRVSIYAGGRGDIQSGRVNVRVLGVIEYLADSFGQVTVSCLISGHRLYARPGVISAHIYGLAADISEVGGVPIAGHQQPGGVTERAVRDVLLLPPEMMPKQVISLLGLGGPSFPLADHYDHIHIGY
jgi:hypothetical protein